jgi:mono/diheme cytochrome c family protein
MRRGALLAALGMLALAGTARLGADQAAWPGVANPERARIDYMLKCQGCHRPDGTGNLASTPPLAGEVAKFLAVPGGREFLGRVPGVASVDLSDERLAEVLNYTLYRFDAAHVPAAFKPYTAAEVAVLRQVPLRLDRAEMRTRLIAKAVQQETSRKGGN